MQRAGEKPLNRISGLVPFCALFDSHLAAKNAPGKVGSSSKFPPKMGTSKRQVPLIGRTKRPRQMHLDAIKMIFANEVGIIRGSVRECCRVSHGLLEVLE